VTSFSATAHINIAAQQATVFTHIAPIDLASIFIGYGPLPAVTGTQNQIGAWDEVGQTRTVMLADGSSANELLTQYDHPHSFSYTVSGFTGVLRFFTTHANGEWWFDAHPSSGTTTVRWHYAFAARSVFSSPLLWLITNVLWRGYRHKALTICKDQIESGIAQQSRIADYATRGG
jgi:hypothetical protein